MILELIALACSLITLGLLVWLIRILLEMAEVLRFMLLGTNGLHHREQDSR